MVRRMATLRWLVAVLAGAPVGCAPAAGTCRDRPVAVQEGLAGEIDALVADLPAAFAVANELRDGVIVGQLPSVADDVEQFGIVLNKGSDLTRCVSYAVDALRDDGTLAALQTTWLAEAGKAP